MNENNQNQQEIEEKFPVLKEKVNWTRIFGGVFLLLVFISLGAMGGYWYSQQESAFEMCFTLNPFPLRTRYQATESAMVAGWKMYSNSICGNSREKTQFAFKYPPTWQAEEIKHQDLFSTYKFSGKEGWFEISCGTGFGGASDEASAVIKLKNQTTKGVIYEDTDTNRLILSQTYLENKGKATFSFGASLIDSTENKTLLENSLSTFEVK